MKKLLLFLSLIEFHPTPTAATAESYDSDTATIKKACCDTMADVNFGSKTYRADIAFTDGATWASVKDHYELSPAAEDVVKSGKSTISISPTGTASFKKGATKCSGCTTCEKKK